ncbi:MAG: nucleoside triphosphate pyrophosphohydrolase [Clostridia bacterium]|nr:nucleoside triphosphate pyrophosphohydrolase [Clostridia bacterium]
MDLTVFALGHSADDLTCGALKALEKARYIILRTDRCAAAEMLNEKKIGFETLDSLYDAAEDFGDLDQKSASFVLERLEKGSVCLGVFDPASDTVVRLLRDSVTAVCPYADPCRPFAAYLNAKERRITAAAGLEVISCQGDLVITEIDSKLLAGDVKLKLLECYAGNSPVILYDQAGKTEKLELSDLDRLQETRYGHRCAALLPERGLTEKERFDIADLIHLMAKLRAPGGCPWDRKQTHESLRPYLIEEAYETAAAILDGDWEHTAEELGDVLLQVVFQADIGRQYGTFTLGDVATNICSKMIRRHRHIFGDADCPDARAVSDEWDRIKAQERKDVTPSDAMDAVSKGLPALMRAEKIQKRAGTDPESACPAEGVDAVRSAAESLAEAVKTHDTGLIEERLGELLFEAVNVGRLCGIEAESCLAAQNEKFIGRIKADEQSGQGIR